MHLNLARSSLHDSSDCHVLEPIFEADLPPEQYAYRPGRNAKQAVIEAEELMYRGRPEVVDADLADYFGSIPHADLLKSVARRVSDRHVLQLPRCLSDRGQQTTDQDVAGMRCRRNRRPRTEDTHDRSPGQTARHSARLTHLTIVGKSLHAPVRVGMEDVGLEKSLGSRIVTYADDLVQPAGNPAPCAESAYGISGGKAVRESITCEYALSAGSSMRTRGIGGRTSGGAYS
jgi:hypothetical protein